jgi:hypothetical protein
MGVDVYEHVSFRKQSFGKNSQKNVFKLKLKQPIFKN